MMPYKLLIVDDEYIVRMDLRLLVNWESLGIEILKDATNGLEALELVNKYSPDIIVLDLAMPQMDGIEVIKELKSKNFAGEIIVLSGCDEFETVKIALKLGIYDYILKDKINEENLFEILKDIIVSIEEKRKSRNFKIEEKELNDFGKSSLKREYLSELVKHNWIETNAIMEKLKKVGVECEFNKYVVIMIEIDRIFEIKEKMDEKKYFGILKVLNELIDDVIPKMETHLYFRISEESYCLIISFDNKSFMRINSEIYSVCQNIQRNTTQYLEITVSAGISKVFSGISNIAEAYKQAETALRGKISMGENRIIHYSELQELNDYPKNTFIDFYKDILGLFYDRDESINKYIDKMFNDIKCLKIKSEDIQNICFEFLSVIGGFLRDNKIEISDIFESDHLPYHKIYRLQTVEEMKNWFAGICNKIKKTIEIRSENSQKGRRFEIEKAIDYLKSNYMNKIILKDLADNVNLSKTYLCHLFKQETGETFIDYLNNIRIDAAKRKIKENNSKIYEVGMECGFENYRYFSKVFKEKVNLTPTEYRDSETADKIL